MDIRLPYRMGPLSTNWHHWVILALGLWLIAAPFVLGYGEFLSAAGSFWGFGFVMAVIAVSALVHREAWEEGIDLILGLCLAVSPWLFNFTGMRVLATQAVIAGMAVMVLAVWQMLRHQPGDHWWHHTHR